MPESNPSLASLRYDHGREWSACTLTGPGKPVNADALAADFSGGCLAFVVADGVGAMPGSPLASAAAAGAAADWIASRDSVDLGSIELLFAAADQAINAALKGRDAPGASTIVLAAVAGGKAIVASVGDSEILAVGAVGPSERLTEIDQHPTRANVLLAWLDGVESFEPHVFALPTLPYRLCLVTDGVAGSLPPARLAQLVRSVPPSEAARLLVVEARAAGSRDDATAIVFSDRIEDELRSGLLPPLLRRG